MNVIHSQPPKKDWLLIICSFSIGTIIFSSIIIQKITATFETSIKNEVIDISLQNKQQIENEISAISQFMTSLASEISHSDLSQTEIIITKLQNYVPLYAFYNMGILYLDGICYTTDDKIIDLSHTDYFKEGSLGQASITKSYPSANGDGKMLNIFSIPIFQDEEVRCILTATYQSSQFAKLMNVTSFQGNSQNMIVDPHIQSMIALQDGNVSSYDSIIPVIKDHANQALDNQFFDFQYAGTAYLSSIVRIEIQDWYLLTYIEKDIAFARLYRLQKDISWIVIGLAVSLGLTTLTIYLLKKRYQHKVFKLTYYNETLQQKNANYFQYYFDRMTSEQKNNHYVMVFDIDGFKSIGLSYDTVTTQNLLKYICQVFLEEMNPVELFHQIEDHFIGLVPTQDPNIIKVQIQKVLDRIKNDIQQEKCIFFRLSIGFCKVDKDLDANTYLLNALLAKKTIKGNTQIPYAFYQDTMKAHHLLDFKISTMFETALSNNEFIVYYQPKYDIRSNRIIGSEALVRWQHPHHIISNPSQFIPIFENNGMIIQLDEWIIQKVCQDMKKMRSQNIEIVPVSINLSRWHLQHLSITQKIAKFIKDTQLDPALFAFEITESAFYDDTQRMKVLVKELHQIGCRVDMDDYGTGISNLSSLAHIDFDVIKLDRSFISGIGNQKIEALINATIDLAQRLNVHLIAEGVETFEQIQFLEQNQCYYVQGYYFSQPLDYSKYLELLTQQDSIAIRSME